MALNLLSEWSRATTNEGKYCDRTANRRRTWCKPPNGWIKVNIDAACYPGSDSVTVGCVVRNDCGLFLRARSAIVRGARTPREAEAISMREALSWIKGWRNNQCIFESDSKLLVDAIATPKGKSLFDTIVEDCSELSKHFEEVLFEFVPRSANSVAHELARAAYSSSGLKEWYNTAPDFLICNLAMDDF